MIHKARGKILPRKNQKGTGLDKSTGSVVIMIHMAEKIETVPKHLKEISTLYNPFVPVVNMLHLKAISVMT